MDYYSGPLQVGDGTAVYTYVGETNRLSQVTAATSTSFSQDAVGNICAIGLRTLLYNQDNRLVRVREGTSILGEYLYNAFSQRTSKTAGGVTTHYLYDFEGNLISEADAAGFVQAEYLYRDGVRLAMAVPSTGAVHFFHNDLVGTPQFMTDSTNTLVWEAIYKPFGETAVNPRSTVVNNFRFQGQYFDQETGYHYNWHRYYDPKTGRYLTPDPIGLAGGVNPYVYAENDPVNRVDPTGLIRIPGLRLLSQKAVALAWRMEKSLVESGGRGTREWTRKEMAELLSEGKVCGYHGHHINSVAANPKMAGDPANIAFKTFEEHFAEHGFNWQNPTTGQFLDRTLRDKLIGVTAAALYGVASILDAISAAAEYSDPVSAFLAASTPGEAE